MPNNTVITMDDLTAYTTKLKSVLDANYSGSGSSGSSGSSGGSGSASSRVDSGLKKLSELVDMEYLNDDCTPFDIDTKSAGFIDASNNKDCGALYKEGNKCHYEIYGGLQISVAANTSFAADRYEGAYHPIVDLPAGFKPDKEGHYGYAYLIRIPDEEHDGYTTTPIPIILGIEYYDGTEARIVFTIPDFSLLSNNNNYAVKYNFLINYDYMLES